MAAPTAMSATVFRSNWDKLMVDPLVLARANATAARLLDAMHAKPFSSFVKLEAGCNRSNAINRLSIHRVPSTGSTTFTGKLATACGNSSATSGRRVNTLWSHQAPTSSHCGEASVATLHDPCRRVVTIYTAFLNVYGADFAGCHFAPSTCKSHWVHRAANVNEFVAELERHWPMIMGVGSLSLTSAMSKAKTPILAKHMVVAVPQSLYIGSHTVLLCTPCIDAQLPRFARELGCFGSVGASQHMMSRERTGGAGKFELSAAGCAAARRLYSVDAMHWDRSCAAKPCAAR